MNAPPQGSAHSLPAVSTASKNSRDKSGEDVYEIFYRASAANSNAQPDSDDSGKIALKR